MGVLHAPVSKHGRKNPFNTTTLILTPTQVILPPLILTPCTPTSFTATAFLHQHLLSNTHKRTKWQISGWDLHLGVCGWGFCADVFVGAAAFFLWWWFCACVFLIQSCWCKKAVAVKEVGVQGVIIKGGNIKGLGLVKKMWVCCTHPCPSMAERIPLILPPWYLHQPK